MPNALEIRGLTKAFEGFKLGPLSLTVPAGAIYGFVGPNGAGKTTTIDLIFGMGGKDGGSISVFGLDHPCRRSCDNFVCYPSACVR
jgi:ABC-2 type transport system ATP-binding protein